MSRIFTFFKSSFQSIIDFFINRKSLTLNGINQYVSLGNIGGNAPLALSSGDFTVSLWAKSNGTNSTFGRIIEKSTGSYTNGWGIFMNTANTEVYWWVNSKIGDIFYSMPTDRVGKCNHIGMVYKESTTTVSAYFNGALVDIETSNPAPQAVSANLNIGTWGAGSGRNYNGNLDQISIWNKAFSIEELRDLIILRDLTQHSAYANILSWYEFEDSDILGTTLIAKAGSTNGTLFSGATNSKCLPYPYTYQLEANNDTPYHKNDGGFAFDFDGVNDYILIPSSPTVAITGAFTLSYWAKGFGVGVEPTGVGRYNSVNFGYYLGINNVGLIRAFIPTSFSTGVSVNSSITKTLNKSQLITMVYKPSTYLRIYVDGVLTGENTTSIPATLYNNGFSLSIGRRGTGSIEYFIGKLADVMILNTDLSTAQVLEIYNNHQPRKEMSNSLALNIKGYWKGYNSNIGGNSVLDMSGSGNNGTMFNMTSDDIIYDYPRTIYQPTLVSSIRYTATNTYTEIPNSNNFNFSNGTADTPFTIAVRVKLESNKNYVGFAMQRQQWAFGVGSSNSLLLERVDGTLNYIKRSNSTINILQTGVWQYCVVTFDGTNVKFYVNGILWQNNQTENLPYVTMANRGLTLRTNNEMFGANISRTSNQSDLTILKNYTVSECQVQEMYNEGSPENPSNWSFIGDVSIKNHWRFNQSDSLTTSAGVIDILGSLNGTAINLLSSNIDTTQYSTN